MKKSASTSLPKLDPATTAMLNVDLQVLEKLRFLKKELWEERWNEMVDNINLILLGLRKTAATIVHIGLVKTKNMKRPPKCHGPIQIQTENEQFDLDAIIRGNKTLRERYVFRCKFVSDITRLVGEYAFLKRSSNAFYFEGLAEFLKEQGITDVIVTGYLLKIVSKKQREELQGKDSMYGFQNNAFLQQIME